MSEPGEMSEFGYIMELLAKGKVSVSAVGLCPRSRLGTHDLRVGCSIGAVSCWGGHKLESGSVLLTSASQLYTMHRGRLFFMSKKGDSWS